VGESLRPLSLRGAHGGLAEPEQLDVRGAGRGEDVESVAQVPLDRPVGEQAGRAVHFHRVPRRVERVLDVDKLGVDELGVARPALVEQVHRVVSGELRGHHP
jgi:hypothetical protein